MNPTYQLEGSELFGYRVFYGDGQVKLFSAKSEEEALAAAALLCGVHRKDIVRRTAYGYRYVLRPPLWRRVLSLLGF